MSAWWALVLVCAVGPWSETAAGEPSTDYATIQRAFLREDFTTVTTCAPTFLQQYPDAPETPRVWLWLSLSLDRLQRSEDALQQLDLLKARLNADDPFRPETLFWEGEISRLSLHLSRAEGAYQQLVGRYPDSIWTSQALLGLGLIAVQQEALDMAQQYFHEIGLRRPGTPIALQARLLEGFCALRLRQFQEATEVFMPLVDTLQDPNLVAQAAFYLGESLSGVGRYHEAVQAYQQAIKAADRSSPRPAADRVETQWQELAYFGLGWATSKIGRCDESLAAFEEYLNRMAGDAYRTEALFAQGSCLMRLEREAEALRRFEEILSRDPAHPLALESGLIVVDAYRKDERFSLAKQLLHTLLRHHTDPASRAQLQIPLGNVALGQGNAAQATTIFELAAQNDQPSIRQAALNGLGDVEMYLGRFLAARGFYEEAVRVNSDSGFAAYANYQVGRVHLALGELDEAVQTFTQLTARAENVLGDEAHLALAIAYLNQRTFDAAHAVLKAIRGRHQGATLSGRAAYYQALLALGEEERVKARQLCDETIALAPRSDEAFEARVLLLDLQGGEGQTHELKERLEQLYASGQLPQRQRGKLAKRLGDLARNERAYAEAMEWYDEAERLTPSLNAEVAYRIASCHEEAGQFDEALTWYQRVDQPPWRIRGLLAAAKLLERQDRVAEAEAIYKQLAAEPIPEAKIVQERLAALREE